jgi:hypothetical protein
VGEIDLKLGDGRTLHAYDPGADDADGRLAVFWHHGTPNIGAPPEPLFEGADRLDIRWVSYATGPGTVDLAPTVTATWHRRPPMSPISLTL